MYRKKKKEERKADKIEELLQVLQPGLQIPNITFLAPMNHP
jgi:hypothetical protein